MPPLPFQIDRSSRLSLTRQLVDGFRRAIAEGRYAEGGLLPSLAEITAATGVCPAEPFVTDIGGTDDAICASHRPRKMAIG